MWFLSPAVCAEQPPGGAEHAAAEPSAGLCSAAGPSGNADRWPWDSLGERRMKTLKTLGESCVILCLFEARWRWTSTDFWERCSSIYSTYRKCSTVKRQPSLWFPARRSEERRRSTLLQLHPACRCLSRSLGWVQHSKVKVTLHFCSTK